MLVVIQSSVSHRHLSENASVTPGHHEEDELDLLFIENWIQFEMKRLQNSYNFYLSVAAIASVNWKSHEFISFYANKLRTNAV